MFFISIFILIIISIDFFIRKGWVAIWNGMFIAVILIMLVLTQKYIGKIEGAFITLIPFIIFQLLIKNNKKVHNFYILKQTTFINWCNKNIYEITTKDKL